jgi:predicted phage terminase large subunit-like protein
MRRSFALFAQRAWAVIDNEPLVWNWHLDAICACLEAVTRGELNDIVINIPPGHAKSMIVSVLWHAWEWTIDPTRKLITSSYIDKLVARDAVRFRDLISSQWYGEHFRAPRLWDVHEARWVSGPVKWGWKDDQNLKMHMKNTEGGERIGVTTGSGTGQRGHCVIVDDPLSAEQAHSDVERKAVIRWFFETMSSRYVDQNNPRRVIIMQRLHEADLAGEIKARGGFEWLKLPSRFKLAERSVVRATHKRDPITGKSVPLEPHEERRVIAMDPRTFEGELLFPARFSAAAIAFAETPKGMGAQAFSAQHQQEPTTPEGNMLKRAWFNRRWKLPGETDLVGYTTRVLPRPDLIEIFTDAAFRDTSTSDRVAIGVVGLKWPDIYLLDLVWDRMSFTETLAAIRDLRRKWKRVSGVCIEARANGDAIINTLKLDVPGVIGLEPEGGKESRIKAAGVFMEAGNVWLPATALDKTGELIEEAVSFPLASHDDGIDMLSYAINRLLADSSSAWLQRFVAAGT